MTSITPEMKDGVPTCRAGCPAYVRDVTHYCRETGDEWPRGTCLPGIRAQTSRIARLEVEAHDAGLTEWALRSRIADMEAELEGTRAARDHYFEMMTEAEEIHRRLRDDLGRDP